MQTRGILTIIGILFVGIASTQADEGNNWYAVVGNFSEAVEAIKLATKLEQEKYPAEVYQTPKNVFVVTLGAATDYTEAERLVGLARHEGLSSDAYVWQANDWLADVWREEASPAPPPTNAVISHVIELDEIAYNIRQALAKLEKLNIGDSHFTFYRPHITLSPSEKRILVHIRYSHIEVISHSLIKDKTFFKISGRLSFTLRPHLQGDTLVSREARVAKIDTDAPTNSRIRFSLERSSQVLSRELNGLILARLPVSYRGNIEVTANQVQIRR